MDFSVNRTNLRECKFSNAATPALKDGQASLRVEKFAFTANNITYAVAGDMLRYWQFFPAQDGMGRIPVWGIGVVEESNGTDLREGDRYFGYFPMSTTLTVNAAKVTPHGFVDASTHRQELPPTYNQYSRMTPELGFKSEHEDLQMLFRPLFMTSFILDDFLADNDFFGAGRVVLSSASSKTAFGLAFLLSQREGLEVVGLTSPANLAFVQELGCYDQVTTYDDLASLPTDGPVVFVDMAGNADVLSAVHHHFGDQLTYSCQVGITHWQKFAPAGDLPGAKPTGFFAPDQIRKRSKDWGPDGLQERFGTAWEAFMVPVEVWIQVVHGQGKGTVELIYRETLEGKAKPNEGHVLTLQN